MDALLESKEARGLESFARALSNEGYARFVLSGYQTLGDRMTNRSSSLHNLCDWIYLGPLPKKDALDLVTIPMKKIGVEFDKGVVNLIVDLGTTVPWLLQYMCYLLLMRLDEQPERPRKITQQDVQVVYGGNDFSRQITASANQDSNMPVLERLIIYLLVSSSDEEMNESRIIEAVRKNVFGAHFTEVRRALNYLTATYILKRENNAFRFFIPQLKAKLRESEPDLPSIVKYLADEFHATEEDPKRGRRRGT